VFQLWWNTAGTLTLTDMHIGPGIANLQLAPNVGKPLTALP